MLRPVITPSPLIPVAIPLIIHLIPAEVRRILPVRAELPRQGPALHCAAGAARALLPLMILHTRTTHRGRGRTEPLRSEAFHHRSTLVRLHGWVDVTLLQLAMAHALLVHAGLSIAAMMHVALVHATWVHALLVHAAVVHLPTLHAAAPLELPASKLLGVAMATLLHQLSLLDVVTLHRPVQMSLVRTARVRSSAFAVWRSLPEHLRALLSSKLPRLPLAIHLLVVVEPLAHSLPGVIIHRRLRELCRGDGCSTQKQCRTQHCTYHH